jgi:hypothetical protein
VLLAGSSTGTFGASGGVLSIVTVKDALGGLVLPATSICSAV